MDKYSIVKKIEDFAPPELAESWDCSGWAVNVKSKYEVFKVMVCLTVTDDIVNQARTQNCDMIISHHPLFFVPLNWRDINIYSAHTNLDKTGGGTTDTLISTLGLKITDASDFLRYSDTNISIEEFLKLLSKVSPNLRYVNNKNISYIKRIAFCAGSGSEFIQEAYENGADALVTGDLKFHTALESPIAVFDIGHFESEILILDVIKNLLSCVEIIFAKEKSPFIQIKY
ncbi:MAG: Nif3-like dinuclear metal center hexameric protein [Candidatus Melainabacteria bacterium 35_41]|nr:MAG: Nif3-like dinuclear metal center hexameric protein [Candidatus Melainabacteria bacterium 35_41]